MRIIFAWDLIESLAQKKRFVVVFDEIQDVLKINDADEVIALLRGNWGRTTVQMGPDNQ